MSIETAPQSLEPAESPVREKLIPTLYVVIGVVVFAVLAALFIGGVIWLAKNAAAEVETLRDIFVIVLSLVSCLFSIVIVILMIMVTRLVNLIEFEIKPVLEKTNETITMVRGTTTFVSENVVKPATRASGYAAGIRRGWKALFGNPEDNLK